MNDTSNEKWGTGYLLVVNKQTTSKAIGTTKGHQPVCNNNVHIVSKGW